MEHEHVLRFAPTAEGFDDAATRLRAILDARPMHARHRHDIEIVFDEVATNIVRHGRPSGPVEAMIRFEVETILTFEDDGVAFDLRDQPAPAPARRRSDLRIGGLGIVIVRELCTAVDYVRTPGQRNRLTLRIRAADRDVDPAEEFPVPTWPTR
jgi:anti-sigma regulatory factor (Ser/Thr protein kinase)